jgi:pilus assembly protein Flp/PilA
MLSRYLRVKNWIDERREGQGLVEYALILVLISIAAIVALTALGTAVSNVYSTIKADL